MAAWLKFVGQAIGNLGKTKQADDAAEDYNLKARQQWEKNIHRAEGAISTLKYRTDRHKSDITRDKINTVVKIRNAQRVREGEEAVEAARVGAAGKRPELALRTETAREAGNLLTEAEVAEQTELLNANMQRDDMVNQIIDNLNNVRPTYKRDMTAAQVLNWGAVTEDGIDWGDVGALVGDFLGSGGGDGMGSMFGGGGMGSMFGGGGQGGSSGFNMSFGEEWDFMNTTDSYQWDYGDSNFSYNANTPYYNFIDTPDSYDFGTDFKFNY